MKVKLEFNDETEGDMEKYHMTSKAGDYYSAIWDFKQALRQIWKYEEHSIPEIKGKKPREIAEQKVHDMVDRIYSMIFEHLNNNDVEGDF